ncbi:MAG: peptidoglycan-binding protein [Candidatus Omnitrophica bacterium]|nr:peptidoglycan-binding protein [Candidatus Omnitrophota bacterium]
MILRLLLGMIFLAVTAGCATTRVKTEQEQLQSRVTALEKKAEEKDSEIVDLQYQVKDLSGKVSTKDTADTSVADDTEALAASKTSSHKTSANDIIRVDVSVKNVQTALKNAGVYSGKIDGKAGSATKEAIIEFQQEHHLTADGVLGRKTWGLLKSYLKE